MQESVLGQHRCPESLKQDVLVAAAIANAGAARAIDGTNALSGVGDKAARAFGEVRRHYCAGVMKNRRFIYNG